MATVKTEGLEMTTSLGGRLKAERERLGLSQAAFAALGGVGKDAQLNYEANRRSPDSNYLTAIAQHGVDLLFVLTGYLAEPGRLERREALGGGPPDLVLRVSGDGGRVTDVPLELKSTNGRLRAVPRVPELDLDEDALRKLAMLAGRAGERQSSALDQFTAVPVHEASVAAGPGRENTVEDVVAHLAFRTDWLRRIGVTPDQAVVARVEGESMAPTIHHGDVVLIDTGRSEPPKKIRDPRDTRPPPIYALIDDGQARVKRLELAAEDVVALLSDNPTSPPDFRPLDRVTIIGKVLWWGHTNRE